MTIGKIFEELSAIRGLPPFAFDENGACALATENGMLHIQCREEAGDIVLTSPIGPADANVRAYVFTRLMAANYAQSATSGGVLALNEELGEVVFQFILKAQGLSADVLATTLENFMTMAEAWRMRVSELVEEAAAAADREDEDDFAYVGEAPGSDAGPASRQEPALIIV